LFVPVPDPSALNLGDTALLMVDLPDGPPRLGLSGKVVWITPKGVSHGGRPSGVGIGFDRGDQATQARDRIERYLGPALSSDRPTWTM
jgi:type IV pilus assembly protein PilZ